MKRSGLRVAYVLRAFPRLSETFILGEIVALKRRGVDVRVLALERTHEPRVHPAAARLLPEVEFLPVRAARTGARAPAPISARHLPYWSRGAGAGRRLALAGVRHLHAHFAGPAATAAAGAAAAAGISFSFTAHAKDIFADGVDWRWVRELGRRASRVVTVCDYNRRYLGSRLPGARVTRVYNGVDLRAWLPPAAPARPLDVVAVGRLVPKKGFEVLIRAMALLRDRGSPATLCLIGDGVERARLEELVRLLGLGSRVRLLGARTQPQVRRVLRQARLMAVPSVVAADGNQDALPTVLLEAGACGIPAVATRVAGIPEIVRHGETGVLVAPDDAAALARALESLLRSPRRCARLGSAARRWIARRFDQRDAVDALAALFHACVRETAHPLRGESDARAVAVL